MMHGQRPPTRKAMFLLTNANGTDSYLLYRRGVECLVFGVTLAFIAVYMLHHRVFKEKAEHTIAVDIVKWFWLFAANAYLWFVLIAEHVLPGLLPLQPLAMVLIMAGFFIYAGLLTIDIHFYWSLGHVSQVWLAFTALGVPAMLLIACQLWRLERDAEGHFGYEPIADGDQAEVGSPAMPSLAGVRWEAHGQGVVQEDPERSNTPPLEPASMDPGILPQEELAPGALDSGQGACKPPVWRSHTKRHLQDKDAIPGAVMSRVVEGEEFYSTTIMHVTPLE